MRKIFILFMFVAVSTGIIAQQPKQSYADQVAIFKEVVHDFGRIREGSPTAFEFIFTNKNTKPIVVSNVISSCGCTVPEWPKQPIAPNATEMIKVTYDSRRIGYFEKSIQVYVQGFSMPVMLKIKGEVIVGEVYDTITKAEKAKMIDKKKKKHKK